MSLKISVAIAATIVLGISVTGVAAVASPGGAAAKRCPRFVIPSGGPGGQAHERAVIVAGRVSCATATKVMKTYVDSGTFTRMTVLGYRCTSRTKKIGGGGVKVLGQTCRKGAIVLKAVSA